jgi:hypothetical protein
MLSRDTHNLLFFLPPQSQVQYQKSTSSAEAHAHLMVQMYRRASHCYDGAYASPKYLYVFDEY